MIEHSSRIAEDKIGVAGDEAVPEVHAGRGIDEERILISNEANIIVDCLIGRRPRRKPLASYCDPA